MRAKDSNRKMDTPFVLMTFCVFAMSVFLVLILGGSAYRNMVDMSVYGQNERIALSYIRTKIRQADSAYNLQIEDFHGVPALSMYTAIGERNFVTRIYFYNGWLYELFADATFDFYPEDGIRLIQLDSIYFFELEIGIIQVVAGTHGQLEIFPRAGRVGVRP